MKQKSELQFISKKMSIRSWHSALLIAGVALLALAGTRWELQNKRNAEIREKIRVKTPVPVAPKVRSASEKQALNLQVNAVREAVRQLNLPIIDLINTLQPPKDIKVALLSVDVSGKKDGSAQSDNNGIMKITAESKSPSEMMTYVAFLDDKPLFKSVYLIKHEINTNSPEKPYRFELEAQWRE